VRDQGQGCPSPDLRTQGLTRPGTEPTLKTGPIGKWGKSPGRTELHASRNPESQEKSWAFVSQTSTTVAF
jgi:hypothetical protein